MNGWFGFVQWSYDRGGPWAIVVLLLFAWGYIAYKIISVLYQDNKLLRESERRNLERVTVLGQAMLKSNERSIEKNSEQTAAIKSLTDALNRVAPR